MAVGFGVGVAVGVAVGFGVGDPGATGVKFGGPRGTSTKSALLL